MNLYTLLRPLIFRLAPETAHHLTLNLLRLAGGTAPGRWMLGAIFSAGKAARPVQAFGLTFKNAVGMAAGYDKDGIGWRGLACLGFGHIELGSVTPLAQPGNPKPRLFRLVEDRAVINRMGFNNSGAENLARRLSGWRPKDLVLGVNIGKNNDTPIEEAERDYLLLLRKFAPLADYLAVNVSCPNTPELRKLQSRQALESLLGALAKERQEQAQAMGRHLPLLVKLSPDLDDAQLDDALQAVEAAGMDGLILTNTTTSRPPLRSALQTEWGGLSGAPLREMSLEMLRKAMRRTGGRLPIVASGGIMTPAEARERLDAGAVLVQVYTGLIYEGPGLVREILRCLADGGL